MSAMGQKQTYAPQQPMSALPSKATAKADINARRSSEAATHQRRADFIGTSGPVA
jgi:hypothetical protein